MPEIKEQKYTQKKRHSVSIGVKASDTMTVQTNKKHAARTQIH